VCALCWQQGSAEGSAAGGAGGAEGRPHAGGLHAAGRLGLSLPAPGLLQAAHGARWGALRGSAAGTEAVGPSIAPRTLLQLRGRQRGSRVRRAAQGQLGGGQERLRPLGHAVRALSSARPVSNMQAHFRAIYSAQLPMEPPKSARTATPASIPCRPAQLTALRPAAAALRACWPNPASGRCWADEEHAMRERRLELPLLLHFVLLTGTDMLLVAAKSHSF
jgi:hypothetical protein